MRALFIVFALVALAALPASAQSQKASGGSTRSSAAKPAATPSAPVNLNTATQAQIEALPGIGPKVAQRIIEYRQKNGQFKKIEEILESSRFCR
jgi:competence protein ComEA